MYDNPQVLTQLRQQIATAAHVPLSAVTLEIGTEEAARRRRLDSTSLVSLTFVIETPDSAAADEAASSLEEQMQDAQAASQLLTTPTLGAAAVDVINLAPMIEEVPFPPPAPSPAAPPSSSSSAPPPLRTLPPSLWASSSAAVSSPPTPPGKTYAPIITVSLTVVGTIETFDQAAFKAALAATLANGIVPADITLTLTEGSVVVDASIRAPSEAAATAAATTLNSQSMEALTKSLGVTVTAISPATVAVTLVDASSLSSAPPSASGSDDDLPMGILLGVAGGGGLLLAVLLAALATCMRSRRLKKLAKKPPQFTPAIPTAAASAKTLAKIQPAPPTKIQI